MTQGKLTMTMLRKRVAERTGMNEKEVGILLSAWMDSMTEAINRGEELYINGFGTFKIQPIAARKSVNVVTGEDIVLEPYNRLKFTASSGLIEAINGNIAVDNIADGPIDPIEKLSNQANEITDILGELGQSPKTKEVAIAQPIVPIVTVPEPAAPIMSTEEPTIQTTTKETKTNRRLRVWNGILTALIIILLLIIAYLLLQQKMTGWIENLRTKIYTTETEVETIQEDPEILAVDTTVMKEALEALDEKEESIEETIIEETPVTAAAAVAEPKHYSIPAKTPVYTYSNAIDDGSTGIPEHREYKEFLCTDSLHQGGRLTQLARRYYKNKALWVFIYEANRDILRHTSFVYPDTEIRIPKLPKSWMNPNNPENVRIWQELEIEYKDL